MSLFKPELVAPGGNLEKCLTAFAFGADACYVGIQQFGLRKSADNFSWQELAVALDYAKAHDKKIYVTFNAVAYDEDLAQIPATLDKLNAVAPHALIVSDMGLAHTIRKHSDIPIHTSTQASTSNVYAAKAWKALGAKRVVLARECSLAEAEEIQNETPIEVEIFVHGAMCSSYSGRCIISNVTAGRDSNRGGCIQSCRHPYQIEGENQPFYIMNSKDLNNLALIQEISAKKIHSLKIEGRMKSKAYVATVVAAYRQALDGIEHPQETWVSHRPFTPGFQHSSQPQNTLSTDSNLYHKNYDYVAAVKSSTASESYLQFYSPQNSQETFYVLSPGKAPTALNKPVFYSLDGQPAETIKQNQVLRIAEALHPASLLIRPC